MNWKMVRLRDLAPPEPAKVLPDHEAPTWLLTLDQIEGGTGTIVGKKTGSASEAGSSTFVFDSGNVLYSKLRPYLNKVVWPQESGVATTELIPLRPKADVLDCGFLTYYLRSQRFVTFAKMCVAGVKMPRIIMDKFWGHKVPLPPISEQRRIVEILDQADAIRKTRDEADAKAERILPALFYKIFGDPVKNPLGFSKENLGSLIKVKSGNFLPAKNMEAGGQYPVYGGNGINGYHSSYMFQKQTVVIGRVGAYCGAVHYTKPNSWVTDNALYVSEMSEALHPRYLTEALRIANLNQYAGRAGQPLISSARISPVEILVPPPRIQDHFIESIQNLDGIEVQVSVSRIKIEYLFSTLLHRSFTGSLTAKWREAHTKELLVEMEHQAKVLSGLC